MAYCSKCGSELPENAKFCLNCGEPANIQNQKNIETETTVSNETSTNTINTTQSTETQAPEEFDLSSVTKKNNKKILEKIKKHKKKIIAAILIFVLLIPFFPKHREAKEADQAIKAIGTVSLDSLDSIENAEKIVNSLTEKDKKHVKKLKKLEKAREKYEKLVFEKKVTDIEDLINEIGEVSINSENAIISAEKAYDKASDDVKSEVKNHDKLVEAREKYDQLFIEKEAKEIEDLINKIGEVTDKSESDIIAARKKYDSAEKDVQAAVKNYKALEDAEEKYYSAKTENVISLINDIGEVSLKSKSKIEKAQKAYDELPEKYQKKVTNSKTLTDASAKYTKLVAEKKKKEIEAKLAKLNKSYDKVKGITFYEPKAYPKYTDTRSFMLPYMGKHSNGNYYLRLNFNYTGDDWIFFKKVTILVDGERYYKTFNYFDIERDNDYGDVWEYIDIEPNSSDIEMLRKVANSKETIIRFEGDAHHYDLTVSASDKQAIKDVLDAYDTVS